MKAITQRESVAAYIKSCLIFQIPRFLLITKYRVISPLKSCCAWGDGRRGISACVLQRN